MGHLDHSSRLCQLVPASVSLMCAVFALVHFSSVAHLAGLTCNLAVQPLGCGDLGNIRGETSSCEVLIQGRHLCLSGLRSFESPMFQLLSGDLSPSRLPP